MRLVNSIMQGKKQLLLLSISMFLVSMISAQDNSPYSRYGLGDQVQNQNVVNRAMGGVSAGYLDFQSINFINPAAISGLSSTIFDVGVGIDIRTLKSNIAPEKYRATNTNISYVQLGFPIATRKMQAKGTFWGLSFGLRPVTRVGYKIEERGRLAGIDSAHTLYEGSGGMNQVSLSTALKVKNLSFGITAGYNFGNKTTSTQRTLLNDTVSYYRSNTESKLSFSGLFLTAGLQYEIKTGAGLLRLGAYGTLPQNLDAGRSTLAETFFLSPAGEIIPVDTIDFREDESGKIKYPATIGGGFTFTTKNNHWMFGADYETTTWSDYRIYGASEQLQNSYKVRLGAQYYPASINTPAAKYFNFVKYRAGVFFGPDQIRLDKNRNEYGITVGAGLPLTSLQRLRFGEYSILNTSIEFGGRGNKDDGTLREGVLRFNFGVSMNARWFQKRKYD